MRSRQSRNQFIIEEFLDGSRINDIVKSPEVNIKYNAVRSIIIKCIGHYQYRRVLKKNAIASRTIPSESSIERLFNTPGKKTGVIFGKKAQPEKKTFWQWLSRK
tara:strand:- start:1812 stop:2123 length:312 start_codon:yes stop_codon:yes gene_type:complete